MAEAVTSRMVRPRRRWLGRLVPRSLAARTALVLLAGLAVVQTVGLGIHALDRIQFARQLIERETGSEVAGIYRAVVEAEPDRREAELQRLHLPSGFQAALGPEPILGRLRPAPNPVQRALRHRLLLLVMPPRLRPTQVIVANNYQPHLPPGEGEFGFPEDGPDAGPPPGPPPGPPMEPRDGSEPGPGRPPGRMPDLSGSRPPEGSGAAGLLPAPARAMRPNRTWMPPSPGGLQRELDRLGRNYAVAMQLPDDGRWLSIQFVMPLADPFLSPTLPIAFLVMTVAAGLLSMWAVRRLTAPLRTLAVAAERLGRDVHSEPLPENGPTEVATAAMAFNTMASRIRRFVNDRTLMLTAIGHDLRTPITRLKLRSEFIEDEELQAKFLADLDELEAMVAATLAFGRDSSAREPMTPLDLNALLATILDDAVDGRPELEGRVGFASAPPAVTVQARPIALKRALTNLIGNAINYGGSARVTLRSPRDGHVEVLVEDDGPGIPASEIERVFEPFVRVETSRNRETGGTGLGLSIARNIVRGLGGDITLANRSPHGLKATVTLVA